MTARILCADADTCIEHVDVRPIWWLIDGYPIGTAIAQEQIHADMLQQQRYIRDHHTLWIIEPDPDSTHRNHNYRRPE